MYTHFYDLLLDRAARHPDAPALGAQQGLGWKTITSRQLLDLTDRLAAELAAEHGVQPGDRVVLWAPNHWRTPVYLFALWKLGAVAVPFDRETNPEGGAKILDSVEPRCIIAGYDERPAWANGHRVTDWWDPGSLSGGDRGLITHHSSPVTGEALAAIFFTSGTTGQPKGCMITHANLCSQVDVLAENIPLDTSCRLASIIPLSHLFEFTCGLLYPLAAGAAIHYIPSRRGPDIVRVLAEQHVTHMIAVPQLLALMGRALDDQLKAKLPAPIYRAMNAAAERFPLPTRRWVFWPAHRRLGGRLRMLASGGAALPAETQRMWERFGVRVVQGYGASECSPVVACGAPDGSTPPGSIGKPVRGVEVRLSPEGELLVRGPNVMRGYWRDPTRTAEVLSDDGWYATGDLATMDRDGNLRLAGRAKDLIVLPSGMKVWPQDVEDALREDSAIKDAAVLPVPNTAGGATLHAYLIPATQAAIATDLGALVARCNGRLEQHQRIATASWWPEADFPRTTGLGKVKRNLLPLPDTVAAVEVDSVAAADDPVGQAIASTAHVDAVAERQTLGELGLDSLSFVELALALEAKTGKAVGDGDLRTEMTVGEVRALLAKTAATGSAASGSTTGADHLPESTSLEQPLWPYTWGRAFRWLGSPFDLLYRCSATQTIVLGREHLADLPPHVIFAGTHHSFADVPLIRHGLLKTPARRFFNRLVIAAYAGGFASAGLYAKYSQLAFGIYPLRQYAGRDASLRGLAKLAAAGNAVLIFPQGAHTEPELEQADALEARFRPGVGLLAQALDAAVVPFGLAGTEIMMPAHLEKYHGPTIANIPVSIKRGPLAIAFGPPLRPDPNEDPHAFAARLQDASFALARQAEQALAGKRVK